MGELLWTACQGALVAMGAWAAADLVAAGGRALGRWLS